MAKLSMGLFSQRYNGPLESSSSSSGGGGGSSKAVEEIPEKGDGYTTTVAPRMFKYLVGRGHPEFSSNRQQVRSSSSGNSSSSRLRRTREEEDRLY